ncbi:MAG: hypothetical protein AAFX55_02600 [Bacteroidota bacterium]
MRLDVLLILLCFGQLALSQTKNEKEERILLSEFPVAAQKVIETLPKHCKRINFYKETDGQKHSFEAKFKYKGKRYSLEFSNKGIIEDLEVLTKFKTLDEGKSAAIKNYFKSSFKKHKLIKVQKQYIFNPQFESSEFVNQILSQKTSIAPKFEIIAEVKVDKQRELREFEFDSEGTFISFRIVNQTSYEHVLY